MRRIFPTVDSFLDAPESLYIKDVSVIVTSGGFDPLHVGHVRCIQESSALRWKDVGAGKSLDPGILIVIVNGDGFLERKKGKAFMPHSERMEIVAALSGVDFVVGWDDGSQTVIGALQKLKPTYFTKGGDRSSKDAVPEFEICQQIGCEIIFGVGGTNKIQSSSNLIKAVQG